MSQSGILADSTTALADVESLTGDSGGAVFPDSAKNIDILGGTGLTTAGTTNTITINQDGLVLGTGQTVGAVTDDVISFDAGAVAGAYAIQASVVGFDSSTTAGTVYRLNNGVRTTGAATTATGSTDVQINEEAALATADADIIVSGNNIIVRVTGVAGLTLEWKARLQYTFIS